jgi:fatty acid synthase subunit alpha
MIAARRFLKGPPKWRSLPSYNGLQEAGMGMDSYNSSPAACAVWNGADAHLLAMYSFSFIEIVKDNPMEKTIHFGGIKG